MARPPWVVHSAGVAAAAAAGLGGLRALSLFTHRAESASTLLYFSAVAVVPVLIWLVPGATTRLARGTLELHRRLSGRRGFYLRLPPEGAPRLRDTALLALGPFSLGLLVIAEVLYILAGGGPRESISRLALLLLLLLAGLLTSLLPGVWALGSLNIRHVDPERGSVSRAAGLFERILGPIGALSLLGSFLTLLRTEGLPYEEGFVRLLEWALRMYPASLAAVAVWRVAIEPREAARLSGWCEAAGIPLRQSLADGLNALRPHAPVEVPAALR